MTGESLDTDGRSLAPSVEKGVVVIDGGRRRGDDVIDEDDDEWTSSELAVLRTKHFVTRFVKGFGSGLGVYTAIKVVTALIKNPFRKR